MTAGHGGSGGRWLVSYADMITLLMVFFVVLYAMSEMDKKKFSQVSKGLNAAFNGGSGVLQGSDSAPPDQPDPPKGGDKGGTKSEVPKDPLTELANELRSDFSLDGRFTVWVNMKGVTISLAGSAAFDSGKAQFKPEFIPLLDAISQRLVGLSNDLSVEGFTDSDPISNSDFASNWDLSTARANRVRAYLEARGVRHERMIVVGYGDTRRVFDEVAPDGKAKNRRVDIVVLRDPIVVTLGEQVQSLPQH